MEAVVATASGQLPAVAQPRLKITEVFLSLQGETSYAGWPTTFIRLTGCPLRCQYCDTTYSFYGGNWRTLQSLLEEVAQNAVRHVCVTGGEPLSQKNCLPLLSALCDAGYKVSLETSGAIDIAGVDSRVARIVDVKTPDSGEVARNLMGNLDLLTPLDEVKFVICSRSDYDWAKTMVLERQLTLRCDVLFSPSFGQQSAQLLADWIVADRLPVRFQSQLHKQLWGEQKGR